MRTSKYLVAALISLCATSVLAADINSVKVVFDPGFTDRTNMGRKAGETSDLTVTFDPGFLSRTGLARDEKDVGPVTVTRDHDYMARTNMGGTGMQQVSTTALKQ